MTRRLGTISIWVAITMAMAACSASTTAEIDDAAQSTGEVVEPTSLPLHTDPPATPGPSTPEALEPTPTEPANTAGRVVVLLEHGDEPRIALQPAVATSTTISVIATENSDTTFGAATEQQSFNGDYDLTLTTSAAPDGFTLVTDRAVRTLNAEGPPPDVGAIVGFRQNYTSAGLPIYVINQQEDAYRRLSGGLLSTPNLLLATPNEPVGVGAQWTIPLDKKGNDVAQVTLLTIGDTTVEVSLTFDRTSDEGTFSMTADGTYSRASLLAHDVTTVSILMLETEASENGQLVPALTQRQSVRIYQEVTS